jgi:hypothetical protein
MPGLLRKDPFGAAEIKIEDKNREEIRRGDSRRVESPT